MSKDNLRKQKVMAAKVLKCGVHRVYIDTDDAPADIQERIANSISREDIRKIINIGHVKDNPKRRAIDKLPVTGQSNGRLKKRLAQKRKGRRQGPGSRKGKRNAGLTKKDRWIEVIRPIRRYLRELRDDTKEIDRKVYRRYYLLAKGGMFKNKAQLKTHLIMDGHLKGE